jgi:hypothetical protein
VARASVWSRSGVRCVGSILARASLLDENVEWESWTAAISSNSGAKHSLGVGVFHVNLDMYCIMLSDCWDGELFTVNG